MSSLKKAGKMPASAFTSPDCAGFLRKEGGRFKTWKKRYFILANNYLYYYTSPTDDDCKGIVSLEDCKVYEHESTDGRKTVVGKAAKDSVQKRTNVFEVYHPIRRAYTLQADSAEEMTQWVEAITISMKSHRRAVSSRWRNTIVAEALEGALEEGLDGAELQEKMNAVMSGSEKRIVRRGDRADLLPETTFKHVLTQAKMSETDGRSDEVAELRSYYLVEKVVLKGRKTAAFVRHPRFLVFSSLRLYIVEPTTLKVKQSIKYETLKSLTVDVINKTLLRLETHEGYVSHFLTVRRNILDEIIENISAGVKDAQARLPNMIEPVLLCEPIFGGTTAATDEEDGADGVQRVSLHGYSEQKRIVPVLQTLADAGYGAQDIWEGNVDLLSVMAFFKNLLVEESAASAKKTFTVEFILPPMVDFRGIDKKAYNLSTTMTVRQIIHKICRLLRVKNSRRFALTTLAHTTLEPDVSLGAYGLGTLLQSWRLRLVLSKEHEERMMAEACGAVDDVLAHVLDDVFVQVAAKEAAHVHQFCTEIVCEDIVDAAYPQVAAILEAREASMTERELMTEFCREIVLTEIVDAAWPYVARIQSVVSRVISLADDTQDIVMTFMDKLDVISGRQLREIVQLLESMGNDESFSAAPTAKRSKPPAGSINMLAPPPAPGAPPGAPPPAPDGRPAAAAAGTSRKPAVDIQSQIRNAKLRHVDADEVKRDKASALGDLAADLFSSLQKRFGAMDSLSDVEDLGSDDDFDFDDDF